MTGQKKNNMRKNKILSVVLVVLFLAFVGIMDYPFLARLYNDRVQGNVAVDYERAIQDVDDEQLEEEWQKAQTYNKELSGKGVALADAFVAVSGSDSEYESLLNVDGSGTMGVIEIPKIGVRLPIYHGTSEEVLQKGAGHLEGSSLPIGGTDTHTCISAHRGLPEKTMFTNLDQLEEGDCFFLDVLGETLCYRIYEIETVRPENTESLSIQQEKDLATLITCTPYGINTHRLYLHGERIPYEEAEEAASAAGMGPWQLLVRYWWIPVTLLLLLWLVYLLYRINRGEKKRK